MSLTIEQSIRFGLHYVELFIDLQLFIMFLWNSRKTKEEREIQGPLSLAFSFLFIFFFIGRFFFLMHDYNSGFLPGINPYRVLAWTFYFTGIIVFLYFVDRVYLVKRFSSNLKHWAFLGYCLGNIIIIFVVYYLFYEFTIAKVLIVVFSLSSVIPLFYLLFTSVKNAVEETRKYMSMLLIGLVVLFVGYVNPLRIPFYEHSFIIGLLVIALGAWRLPALSILDWKRQIQELYISTRADGRRKGVCFFAYSFSQKGKVDPQEFENKKNLVSQDKNLRVINESTSDVSLDLISGADSKILRDRMRELIDQIELSYQDILPRWSGNFKVYEPILNHIQKIFDV